MLACNNFCFCDFTNFLQKKRGTILTIMKIYKALLTEILICNIDRNWLIKIIGQYFMIYSLYYFTICNLVERELFCVLFSRLFFFVYFIFYFFFILFFVESFVCIINIYVNKKIYISINIFNVSWAFLKVMLGLV